ncbi:hypothetical protein [Fictibacillus terranigra]|uniref:Uncharacterized protein n=1 Tax=Fictibacillus terranigra TaxID=3058424 RepID=A0ABT8E1L1_9BACL|nr:hypothetical protein [Fictibacillus sp. CENA-BCM004]MDN4071791.1 hypothetical protein [Fictibacillus sp. CENA-BCM004]
MKTNIIAEFLLFIQVYPTGCSKDGEHQLDDKELKAVAAEVAKNDIDRKQNRELIVKTLCFHIML